MATDYISVKDLRDICEKLIVQGKGEYIVCCEDFGVLICDPIIDDNKKEVSF